MKIIIVGAGKIGSTLAKQLVNENHEVTVIDKNINALNRVVENTDCMGIVGNGAVQKVLFDAGIESANIIIASTNSDEVNMLTCLMAHKYSNCYAIARIRDPEYAEEINYLQNELNLSLVINPEQEAAKEIYHILKQSQAALLSESFFNDNVFLLKVAIEKDSILCDMKLTDIVKKLDCNIVMCVIERDDEIIIPKGNDIIKANDKISFVADIDNSNKFFINAGYIQKSIKNILIVGGGKIAYYLIKMIRDKNKTINIKIMDNDKKICTELADNFNDITVVNGDGSDQRLLLQEGLNRVDAFITLTGVDEENMIYSLYAKKISKAKIITKINETTFSDTLKELDVGSIINPEIITTNLIIKQVRSFENNLGSDIVNFYKLCNGQIEAIEFFVSEENEVVNKEFKELNIKKDIIIACIKRNNRIIVPTGRDKILKNDNVVIITKDLKVKNLKDILN